MILIEIELYEITEHNIIKFLDNLDELLYLPRVGEYIAYNYRTYKVIKISHDLHRKMVMIYVEMEK